MSDSFPRQQARTQRFRLGAPGHFVISADEDRVLFTRSKAGDDAVNCLLALDRVGDSWQERTVLDPATLIGDNEDLPAAERARRERLRETSSGVTDFSADAQCKRVVCALSGQLFVVDVGSTGTDSSVRPLPTDNPVIDPRISPDGAQVAWVSDGALWHQPLDADELPHVLAEPAAETVTWGLADFAAAEEFDRVRGFWWSPESDAIIAERVDTEPVSTWFISDPSQPTSEPTAVRYPAAGTANADTTLWLFSLSDNTQTLITLPQDAEYIVDVTWSGGPALVTVINRQQTTLQTYSIQADGQRELVDEQHDPQWVELLPGTPCWGSDGELVTGPHVVESLDDGWFARGLVAVTEHGWVIAAHCDPTGSVLIRRHTDGSLMRLIDADNDVYRSATVSGSTAVVVTSRYGTFEVQRAVVNLDQPERSSDIASNAWIPPVELSGELLRAGKRDLAISVQWPTGHVPGSSKLPVIMHPYGGPHAQRVLRSGRAFAETQWLADRGFCVIVADGRGSPGRGPEWERTIKTDLATPALDDQIDALHAVAERFSDDIDLERVGITGWSFGGYLAALAVLRRPDVFHAAVAGAPVTEWRLYDTAYTERYLGHPDEHPEDYDASSLLPLASELQRPLMIIHGLADDNVVVAHSLQLSGALTAAGKAHTFVPLANVTHMTPQEEVAENLLVLQAEFLQRELSRR